MLPEEAANAVRVVVAMLVRGEYEELETLTEGRGLSASGMARAVASSGRDLIGPPDDAFTAIDAAETEADGRRVFHIAFPLWTAQEGRSPMRLRLTLTEVMDGVWAPDLDGIDAP